MSSGIRTRIGGAQKTGRIDSAHASGTPSHMAALGTATSSLPVRDEWAVERRWAVETAGPGDHFLIYQFLRSVFHAPTESEFHAQLDHPRYQPLHRLVVRQDGLPAAHLRICPREMKFGPLRLPIVYFSDLGTLPELRGRGLATSLLSAALRRAALLDNELALLRTSQIGFYARRGWAICGRHSYSTAPPRSILAVLSSAGSERRLPSIDPTGESDRPRLQIRLWRHVEQDNLMQLYKAATRQSFGPLVRSDAYWRWLVSRRGYDRIYVAVEGRARVAESPSEPIVGYAAMKRGRIVELFAADDRTDVQRALLARACGDAIERDDHVVRYDGPPGAPLHEVIRQSGGRHCSGEVDAGQAFMVRLLDPLRFLDRILPVLHERAREAGLPRPFELGLQVEGKRLLLLGTRRSVRLVEGKLGRSYLSCRTAELTQLLLGHVDPAAETGAARIAASTQNAAETAAALFPRLPLWYPPLDDLPA